LAQFSPNSAPAPTHHRYPIHEHRIPSHLACNCDTVVRTGTLRTGLVRT
jgi:hypothetical protein